MADPKSGARVTIQGERAVVKPWRKVMGQRSAMPHHTPVQYDGSATVLMVPTALLAAA